MSSSSQPSPGCSKILTTLLKNFNPYEILEPQKVSYKTEKLIDIEPDYPESNVDEGTIANALMPKINPDLIDLFENIFVTPQHIEKQKGIDNNISETERLLIDWPTSDVPNVKTVNMCKNCCNINILPDNDAPKVLVPPKLPLYPNPTKTDKDLTNKTLGFNSSIQKIDETVNMFQNLTQSFHLNASTNNSQEDFDDHEKLLDEILQSKTYEKYMKEQNEAHTQNASPQIPKTHANDAITRPSQSSRIIDLTRNNLNKENNIDNKNFLDKNFKLLATFKKDEKLYLKKRIIKSEAMKRGFTKGPDLREKSIVLPQITERLKERNKLLEGRKVLKRRLILDTGPSNNTVSPKSTNTPSSLNPILLMEDCNRERLIAFKTREALDNFVRSGHF